MELNPSQPSGPNNACEIHPESCLALKTLFLKKTPLYLFQGSPGTAQSPFGQMPGEVFPGTDKHPPCRWEGWHSPARSPAEDGKQAPERGHPSERAQEGSN